MMYLAIDASAEVSTSPQHMLTTLIKDPTFERESVNVKTVNILHHQQYSSLYLQGNGQNKVEDIEQSLSTLLMLPEVGMVHT